MDVVPHLFGDVETGHEVVMLAPVDDITVSLLELARNGENVSRLISEGYVRIDTSRVLGVKCPRGMKSFGIKWRKTP